VTVVVAVIGSRLSQRLAKKLEGERRCDLRCFAAEEGSRVAVAGDAAKDIMASTVASEVVRIMKAVVMVSYGKWMRVQLKSQYDIRLKKVLREVRCYEKAD
jgi:hypothetical protein